MTDSEYKPSFLRRESSNPNDQQTTTTVAKKGSDWKDELDETDMDFEGRLFDFLCDSKGKLSVARFKNMLSETGLRDTDPRLKESMDKLDDVHPMESDHDVSEFSGVYIDRNTFSECIKNNVELIAKAFSNNLVIPEFAAFKKEIDMLYRKAKSNKNGKNATYIPQLARYDPEYWAVSVCTVDGQRHSIGNTKIPFCIQSMSKPLMYALVTDEHGPEYVHNYVGQEPSGRSFNEISLDYRNKPHNPMINPGAIITTSLFKPELNLADRFDYIIVTMKNYDGSHLMSSYMAAVKCVLVEWVISHLQCMQTLKRMSGGEFLSFNNAVFLSERQTADRNFALAYFLRENKCFPNGEKLMEVLDFYFQQCSLEVNCDSLSVIAATLANGGVCPITGDKILHSYSVRNTLSLMHSCGMYDYSGEFAFKVGLPAKSGVSGGVILVVPNVMGIAMWSPPLDQFGNSCRGIQFCKDFVSRFNFHHYDNIRHSGRKMDPRRTKIEAHAQDIVSLLFGASKGDLTAIRRYAVLGLDMQLGDYDGRTALHVAAAEGQDHIVKFLLEKCKVSPSLTDRWGFTPLDDARRFGHTKVIETLETHGGTCGLGGLTLGMSNLNSHSDESCEDDTQENTVEYKRVRNGNSNIDNS